MKNIGGAKAVLIVLILSILSYLGYQYYEYMQLKGYLQKYQTSLMESHIMLDITDSHDEYGVLWPHNKEEMNEALDALDKYWDGRSINFLKKYGFNIKIDTVYNVNEDTSKIRFLEYKLYSYGPDKKDGNLKNLPFNNGNSGEALLGNNGNIIFKNIPFWNYLFMNKDFDIIMVYALSEYDCTLKKYHQTKVYLPGEKTGKMVSARILKPGYKSIAQENSTYNRKEELDIYTKKFNQTLQTIRESLVEQYPDTPTEGLIFNYNGKRVRCICSFNVPDAPVTTIEKILTEKLNATTDYIGMAAFYMEVPVLK